MAFSYCFQTACLHIAKMLSAVIIYEIWQIITLAQSELISFLFVTIYTKV